MNNEKLKGRMAAVIVEEQFDAERGYRHLQRGGLLPHRSRGLEDSRGCSSALVLGPRLLRGSEVRRRVQRAHGTHERGGVRDCDVVHRCPDSPEKAGCCGARAARRRG